jgi:hypothetical protein
MTKRLLGSLGSLVVVACATSSAPTLPVSSVGERAGEPGPLELLAIRQIESSPTEGTVVLRLANSASGPVVAGIDVRAEPGMWLAPVRQETALLYVPPEGERTVSVGYSFTHLSPAAILHVRVGVAEEHGGGWVHIPEPVAVRRFDLGGSEAARAFLQRFDRRATPHITVYATRGMFSAEQLDSITASRAHAVVELSRLLGVPPPPGLMLVFYPDGVSKTAETDHVGAGMTKGNILAEVFNDSVRLDPYHEIAHAVAGQLGWAPAWLNEGFAVYASEHLGADALAQIGSAGKTVYRVTCEHHQTRALLPMSDLMLLPDIGPAETLPHVAYPQAASFTGFLAQRFGLHALRRAYASLAAMGSPEENEAAFVTAFGVSSQEAARLWLAQLDQICQ